MQDPTFNLMLIGSGGDGVMSTANLLLQSAAQKGYYGILTQSYGPQIRGGESAAHITLGTHPVSVTGFEKDLVVVFRFSDAARFVKEFKASKSLLLFHDAAEKEIPSLLQGGGPHNGGSQHPIPFQEILEKHQLPEISKNILVFGILLRALDWNLEEGRAFVSEVFSRKSKTVIETNLRALEIGYQTFRGEPIPFLKPQVEPKNPRWVITGNEACAKAAVAAGCRFYAGYPITPSSEILEEMSELLPRAGGNILQAEDEIAAMGMIIGASFGGVPAMTATSGPGLSLMTEMIGLSSMTEIPVVIVDCQRAGPSTGIPSRMEQGDLWHAIYGGHGDFPRAVLAPTDAGHCYSTLFRAFHCAENYQLPVIVLSDALTAQATEIVDPIDTSQFPKARRSVAAACLPSGMAAAEPYRRFDFSSPISPMALPGTAGLMHSIAGIEHTEFGTPSSDGEHHHAMNQKRFQKFEELKKETRGWHSICGSKSAPTALIAWGSSARIARELAAVQSELAVFVPEILHPFPIEALKNFLEGREKIYVLEMNYQGQLYHYLRALGGIPESAKSLSRSGGIPFHRDELQQRLQTGGDA